MVINSFEVVNIDVDLIRDLKRRQCHLREIHQFKEADNLWFQIRELQKSRKEWLKKERKEDKCRARRLATKIYSFKKRNNL